MLKQIYLFKSIFVMLQIRELNFKSLSGLFIDVVDWPQETTKAKKKACISNYSDHSLIYGKIIK